MLHLQSTRLRRKKWLATSRAARVWSLGISCIYRLSRHVAGRPDSPHTPLRCAHLRSCCWPCTPLDRTCRSCHRTQRLSERARCPSEGQTGRPDEAKCKKGMQDGERKVSRPENVLDGRTISPQMLPFNRLLFLHQPPAFLASHQVIASAIDTSRWLWARLTPHAHPGEAFIATPSCLTLRICSVRTSRTLDAAICLGIVLLAFQRVAARTLCEAHGPRPIVLGDLYLPLGALYFGDKLCPV